MAEKVVLVTVGRRNQSRHRMYEDAEEMKELVRTAGGQIAADIFAPIDKPSSSHYIHSGKALEIQELVQTKKATLAILNVDLSPVQSRNLEETFGAKVVDRTGLILDIFAKRAQSSEGRMQVELAQLNYLLPRLVGQGVLMSRLGGGIGTRGPGEQKLEVNRRKIRNRISKIKEELKKVQKHRGLIRESRRRKLFKSIAIVGYTNAGKSSLLNALTGATAFVEDKLFATLDPATRVFSAPKNKKILLTDTVGFLRNLPHHLIEAFKATLEEVTEADALVHVLDVANLDADDQFRSVNQQLEDLGAMKKPTILVLNKVDLLSKEAFLRARERFPEGVLLSVKQKKNFPELIAQIENLL